MEGMLLPILALVVGIIIGCGLTAVLALVAGETIAHQLKYKVWTLPCPACRDDETDEPTGLQPEPFQSAFLNRQVAQWTEDGEHPEFPCSTCEGTKVVSYEYPRNKPPTINERNIITSTLPGQMPTKKRRRTV